MYDNLRLPDFSECNAVLVNLMMCRYDHLRVPEFLECKTVLIHVMVCRYDYLRVSEFSDNISTVPPEILMGEAPPQPQPQGDPMGGQRGGLRGPPPDLENRNGVMVFLETLLPWNDYGVDPNARNDRGD